MIKIEKMHINDAHNKTFISLEKPIVFEDNTVYFIIGKSGVGKTSIIDFLTSPFTDDPIKNGKIVVPDRNITIENSDSPDLSFFYQFIRKHIAFIPQKTDSLHPAIPLRKQLENFYKIASPKNGDFEACIKKQKLSKIAGFDDISFNKDSLFLTEQKNYIDENKTLFPIIGYKDAERTFEGELSSGQRQRLLILTGLMQFSLLENPILIGDEFLVNFTYLEANEVLNNVLSLIKEKSGTAIFIAHDLSFPCLRELSKEMNIRLILIEGKGTSIVPYEIPLRVFFDENKEKLSLFDDFVKSYKDDPLDKCDLHIKKSDAVLLHVYIKNSPEKNKYIDYDDNKTEKNLYENIHLDIKENKFIVITGFSGVGKSTLCEQIINDISDKKTFRYFPSTTLSSISEDSQITVEQDLINIYEYYYNSVKDLSDHKEEIEGILKKVELPFSYDKFMKQKIYDLSGGQQQRYWLARILFHIEGNKHPKLLFLDESIASLDCMTKNDIIRFFLKEVLEERGITIVLISHDLRDIGVIDNTLGKDNEIFEHYEMLNHTLYKVMTRPFSLYKKNLEDGKSNEYDGNLLLKLEGTN
jgi:ABC-type dipeptide/oligopeptide/nickel transport system ATPase subunit